MALVPFHIFFIPCLSLAVRAAVLLRNEQTWQAGLAVREPEYDGNALPDSSHRSGCADRRIAAGAPAPRGLVSPDWLGSGWTPSLAQAPTNTQGK